ncbi:hypothetical protein [Viridibacillus arvi]|uniref:hypothetical protein n=1 Tax=Viridibacillus arvi TaxID=263475 RepID=UPI0034CE2253
MTVVTYRINKNVALKRLEIAVGDKMTLEEAVRFEKEFQRNVASIDASTYTLEIDCTTMKVLNPDIADKLGGAMSLYKQAGFKTVEFTVKNDTTLKMQLKRIARSVGLTNAEVIDK